MNFGNSIKKLNAKLNLVTKIHHGGQIKQGIYPKLMLNCDTSLKCRNDWQLKYLMHNQKLDVSICNKKLDSSCSSPVLSKLMENGFERLHMFSFSKKEETKLFFCNIISTNLPKVEIIEPGKNINIKTPVRNDTLDLDSPSIIREEIIEPKINIITKRAINMKKIKKRKMRKHKWRKTYKKLKAEFAKRKQKNEMKKEMVFQDELKQILKIGKVFSAENHITENLKKVNWNPPITKVRGYVAPPEIVKQHLDTEAEKEKIKKRIEECFHFQLLR